MICGQDKAYIGALLWPSPAAMKAAIEAAGGDARQGVRAKLHACRWRRSCSPSTQTQAGSSRRIGAFKMLTTPPSLDAGEITDKGYVNQRVAQDHRASDVAALFAAEVAPGVVKLT